MEFLSDYGLFLAKSITVLVTVGLLVAFVAGLSTRARRGERGHLEVKSLNDAIGKLRDTLQEQLLHPSEKKRALKARLKAEKKAAKHKPDGDRRRVFVINFKGDLRAGAVSSLREEVTAILGQAREQDEVVVRLESPGGMVHSYGLAASQLDRFKKAGVPVTVCVDKVAASGGYMMACVADRILAAPFAFIGSIGVVAQLPNFHRLLKKHDIDYEVLTAGEHKRTLTLFGENTEKGREKFIEDLQETHDLFKDFVREHRPSLDMKAIATGEVWLGSRARDKGLVDDVCTSDEYITSLVDECDLFEVQYVLKKSLPEKVGMAAEETADGVLLRWARRFSGRNYMA